VHPNVSGAGLGAKAVISSYPDHKGWKLSFVKKVCTLQSSRLRWPMTSFPLSQYSALLFPAEQSKLESVKMMGARDKINAILLNVKINKRKSVHTRGYN